MGSVLPQLTQFWGLEQNGWSDKSGVTFGLPQDERNTKISERRNLWMFGSDGDTKIRQVKGS